MHSRVSCLSFSFLSAVMDGRKGSQIHKSAGDIVVHKSAGDIVEERREAIANLCDNEREHHIRDPSAVLFSKDL